MSVEKAISRLQGLAVLDQAGVLTSETRDEIMRRIAREELGINVEVVS